MRVRICHPSRTVLIALVVGLLSVGMSAQDSKPRVEAIGNTTPTPLPPGGPPPRDVDGRVDLSGVWFSGSFGRPSAWSTVVEEEVKEDPVPFFPEVAAKIKAMSRTEIQLRSPDVNCLPKGVPGVFVSNPHPTQIVQKPGVFIQLVEVSNDWRLVHTDGRPHQEYPDPLFYGDAVGRWEGDTLVIDTISIDERTWVMGDGWYHSDQLHVIERLRRPSMNYLEYQFTVEDPKVLTRPWTSGWRKFSLGRDDLLENYCTNNQNPEELQKLLELEAARKK